MAHPLQGISDASRARDWRRSFVPFIMGCVYLWIRHFYLPFDAPTMRMLVLSLLTTVGFASLGYFINEYFDRAYDARARKANRLAYVPQTLRMMLLTFILLFTFLPWVWLPHDMVTWVLIISEIALFLLYAMPFPRLKAVPVVSNVVDMGYAYLLPLLLSFHTYSLYIGQGHPGWIFPLMLAVSVIGFRNIVIHQVNDLFSDRRAGLLTLPNIIGPTNTSRLIAGLFTLELVSFLVFGIMLADGSLRMLVVTILFLILLVVRLIRLRHRINFRYLPLEPLRHLTDPYYQIVFPALLLLLLVFRDWRWAILIPFHALLFIPKDIYVLVIAHYRETFWWAARQQPVARAAISAVVNYPIYWLFRLFGVDLVREGKSAADFIRSKFS